VRSIRLSLAAAVLTLAIAGSALAATGDLTPQGCIQDSDALPDTCTQITAGLNEAQAIAVSPDGTSVYATSLFDDAVMRFDRDPSSGALTPQGCIEDNDTGDDKCAVESDGLSEVKGLALSPDGRSLYAVSGDNAIVRFGRDTATGALDFQDCIEDEDNGSGDDDCDTTGKGLGDPYGVAVSPDGVSVYVASLGDDAVARFDRTTGTGELAAQSCVDDNDLGSGAGNDCSQDTDGLDQASAVAVSPDGASVYASSQEDDAVVRLARAGTGAITPQDCVDDDDTGNDTCDQDVPGLDQPRSIAVSPDNASLYVASAGDDDAVVRFDRAGAGALTPQGCIEDNDAGLDDCSASADGLDDPFSVAVSGDGLSVYVAARGDDAVTIFDRSPNPGALTPKGCIDDNDPPQGADDCAVGTDGLNGAVSVAVSADGTSLYAVSQFDQAAVAFGRDAGAAAADTDPPETTIAKGPKRKTKKRKAKFEFASDEPGSTFVCKLDKRDFAPCDASEKFKVKRRKHKLLVAAVDPAGNVDATPAKRKWKVRKRK
jgi:DNA-binding beta-propeller fold protein YncE